ncbi:acyl-CoA N-acyltransferase [Aaosphaeria arxii CBS 175.79]|uniref:Acyl-CoA N-acyltransferase n=1 Tax=Aaosphaeria arxii CBS 175.79 TaxID=1450172 RepID=A0A6A5XEL4_9PLEO|nr:acyl-CoA N-acyltransferase [Aaosphaeria arxii CBS 175.79]KAF2011350.1 acyl-CoA N-acyltransferase [Aaosphaeria arxii CBS 175.79]
MYIRPMTRADTPEVAAITTAMLADDEIFRWLSPGQDKYPDDLRRWHVIRIRSRIAQAGSHGFVMATEESDPEWSGREEVTGLAFFIRRGDDEAARKWQRSSLLRKIDCHLLSWEQWYEEHFLDRAQDTKRMEIYMDKLPTDLYNLLGPRWHVGLLGVSPKYQRRGIGGRLLQYGLKFATEEDLPVTLEASAKGHNLYLRSGFKIIADAEIVDGLRSAAMVWEPEGSRGRWLRDVGDQRAEIVTKY